MLMTDEAQFLRNQIRDIQNFKEKLSTDKRILEAVHDGKYMLLLTMENNLQLRLDEIEREDQDE